MLGDIMQLILQSIEFLWPLKTIHQWERGLYLIFGRVYWDLEPGMYPVIPWFTKVLEVSVAWDPVQTGECDITTKDNKTLTFDATALIRNHDIRLMTVDLHDADVSATQIVRSVLSEKLAEVDAERMEPGKRTRLNTDLKKWIEKELEEFGIEVKWIRFTTFVVNPRMIRLLGARHLG